MAVHSKYHKNGISVICRMVSREFASYVDRSYVGRYLQPLSDQILERPISIPQDQGFWVFGGKGFLTPQSVFCGLSHLLGIEKKLQKKIIFVFQRFPKGGVDTQIVDLFYDSFFFDENARILE